MQEIQGNQTGALIEILVIILYAKELIKLKKFKQNRYGKEKEIGFTTPSLPTELNAILLLHNL
ncbi:hypothetical protein CN935_00005, partial [Bacillus cereus]